MPNIRVRDIIDEFMESDDIAKKVDASKYVSPRSAYFSFLQCVRNKRIKGCFVHLHKGTVYLIKE